MTDERIGRLFPAGGPVPPDLVIGRTGDIDEISRRLREGIHTMLIGPRRIGKTTVCGAACERLRDGGTILVDAEVPERPDSTALLQLVIDRCSRISFETTGRKLFRTVRPLIEGLLRERGIPLDLSQWGGEPDELPTRAILSLPLELAGEMDKQVILYLDELQRAVDYADAEALIADLVDLYSGSTDVVVLVDGSEERTLDGMLGAPLQVGKLCDRLDLAPTIPGYTWRDALPGRFAQAGLTLETEALEELVAFGAGRPYATMTCARYAALNARKLGAATVGAFEAKMAVDEARKHLDDDE
jgi:hypothetical protein